MTARVYLTHDEQAALIARLAGATGLRAPTLRRKKWGGSYSPLHERINAGQDMTHDNVLHEFAHHVVHLDAVAAQLLDPDTRRPPHHGRTFFFALVRLIKLDGRAPSEYDWRREYRTVYKFAARRGFVAPDHRMLQEQATQRARLALNLRRPR